MFLGPLYLSSLLLIMWFTTAVGKCSLTTGSTPEEPTYQDMIRERQGRGSKWRQKYKQLSFLSSPLLSSPLSFSHSPSHPQQCWEMLSRVLLPSRCVQQTNEEMAVLHKDKLLRLKELKRYAKYRQILLSPRNVNRNRADWNWLGCCMTN